MNQSELYQQFLALHQQTNAFVMPNVWDGLSALLFKQAGFAAVATSSAALAATLGRRDGTHAIARQEHLRHATLLTHVSGLPINGDFEDGYGQTPDQVADTVRAAIDAGLAGIGIEDTSANPDQPIRTFDDAVARMRAAARAARGRIVLTGRTDNFLYDRNDLDDTIRRLTAFADAGADVLYAPAPPDMNSLTAIIAAVAPKPVNALIGLKTESPTLEEFSAAGVKRVSTGSKLYLHSAAVLQRAAAALSRGELVSPTSGMALADVDQLMRTAGA